MNCPKCGSADTHVMESRAYHGTFRRRRECECGYRFTTYEANEQQWKAIKLMAEFVKEVVKL